MKNWILILIAILGLTACEKEVDIDLRNSDQKYVIEGNLSNIPGESKVRITTTLNFGQNEPFPVVRGALVTITDNALNQSIILEESLDGYYSTYDLVGIEGRSYTMSVSIGNKIFTAVSEMPYSVVLDSLSQQPYSEQATQIGADNYIQIFPHYKDPLNFRNFYQFVVSRNDTLVNDLFIRNDSAFNGSSSPFPIWVKATRGDLLTVDLQCIDRYVYKYLFGLSENIYQSTATPANPESNFSNGALGFFKAHTSYKKLIRID
jgi:hypothetical protein